MDSCRDRRSSWCDSTSRRRGRRPLDRRRARRLLERGPISTSEFRKAANAYQIAVEAGRHRVRRIRTAGSVPEADEGYFINEEESPRAGRIAARAVQRARWFDGRTFVWIGRRVSIGKGEGSSGLILDQIEPVS